MPFQSLNLDQKKISVKKGTILQFQGDTVLRFYKVEKGLLRSYVLDEKAKEHTFLFAPEKWLIGDVHAFSKNLATELFIDALEDSELIVVNTSRVEQNSQLTLEEYKVEFDKLLNRVGVLQERILMQMSSSALSRYQHFVRTYPDLAGRVSQKMIASYLGITPEALSKVRSDWMKGR